jgi:hypothetical protein
MRDKGLNLIEQLGDLPKGSQSKIAKVAERRYRAIGVRTSGETILYSRNHKNFNKRFPQIAGALGDLEMFWFHVRSVSPEPALTRSNFGYAFTPHVTADFPVFTFD